MGTDPWAWKYYDGTKLEKPYTWDLNENPNPHCNFGVCKSLIVWHFNPKSKSFCDLPCAEQLERLEINWANPTSFNGLGKFKKLRELELYYCSKINSLDGLTEINPELSLLSIFNVKKVNDFSDIGYFKKVENLRICDCGDIDSIDFILDMPNLKKISFAGSNVTDGDMTTLLKHSPKLEFVGFDNKRHYSHSWEDVCRQLGLNDLLEYTRSIKQKFREYKNSINQ